MASVSAQRNGLSLRACGGDAKTLLAFTLPKAAARNLAGFTIRCQPHGAAPYHLHNLIQFERPADHVQDPKEPAGSSINAPIPKFRRLHVPGRGRTRTCSRRSARTRTWRRPRHFDDRHALRKFAIDPTPAWVR